jgi:hypothetical protein
MKISYKIILLFALLALIASSCPEENPDLVSPPSFSESVNIRFMNMNKNAEFALAFDGNTVSTTNSLYQISKYFNPDNDSAFVSLLLNNNKVNELSRVTYFQRDINYIFASVPHPDDLNKDTIFTFTNLGDIVVTEVQASVKFVNFYADTKTNISIIEGCPGGTNLTKSPLNYLDYTSAEQLKAGEEYVFSVIKYLNEGYEIVGTFKSIFIPQQEYSIIIAGREDEEVKLFLLDELNLESTLIELEKVNTQTAKIKLNNLTENNQILTLNITQLIQTQSLYQSEFKDIPACQSANSETFTIESSSKVEFSPVVNQTYNAIAFNVSNTYNTELMIIPPPELSKNRIDKAVVRCINLGAEDIGLNISIGANSNFVNTNSSDTIRNYSSGLALTNKLLYKKTSNPVLIESGLLPILVFNSKEPSDYLYSFVYNFEKNKNYLIVSYKMNNETKYTVIEEEIDNFDLVQLEEASIVNIINGNLDSKEQLITMSNSNGKILNNAKLSFGYTLTSLINASLTTISFDNNSQDINIESGKRVLVVNTNNQIYDFQTNRQISDENNFQIRIANFSDYEIVRVKTLAGIDTTQRYDAIDKNILSNYIKVNSQGRIFVIFEDRLSEKIFYTSPEVNVSRRKIYTLVLLGNKEKGYNLVTIQDY